MSARAGLGETELEMVQRHVREGERHLTLQHKIISWLADHGNSTAEAERLLRSMADMQRMDREHLARLEKV